MKNLGVLILVYTFLCSVSATTTHAQTEAVVPATVTQLTDHAIETVPSTDVTSWAISAGSSLNTGNTSSATASAGTTFRLVRGRNNFELESTFNLGAADATPTDTNRDFDLNTRNWNSRARYDRFFTDNDAAYFSMRHRWDTFAGIETRLQFQTGYLRNVFKKENHRFWFELGYDLTYDNYVSGVVPNTDVIHAGRGFLGYQNHLNEHVEFLANAETLLNFEDINDVRINADTTLRASVASHLQLEVQFKLQFDNVPVTGKEKLDTQTTLRLVYALY